MPSPNRFSSGVAGLLVTFGALLAAPSTIATAAEAPGPQVEGDRQRQDSQHRQSIEQILTRIRRVATARGLPVPSQWSALRDRAKALDGKDAAAEKALRLEARRLARRTAFEAYLDFDRLVFVKRFCQETYPDVCLNHMPWVSRPGGDICILTLAGPDRSPVVRNVLNGRLGPGHVHGMDLDWDGDRVVFGYAKTRTDDPPEGWLNRATSFHLRNTEEPTHLFEVGIDGRNLRQLTDGEWSDLDPTYLADGRVAFVSERCAASLQCNELDKDETSCNLYVVRPDGTDIRQLSVSKDGDYLPHALDDGSIGYTRWEYQERNWANIQSIWTIRPDGTGADSLYKQHMNNPWSLEDVRSIPGSHRLVAIAAGHHTLAAGPVVLIDPREGMNRVEGLQIVTPGVLPPEGEMAGTPVPEGGVPGRGGHYMTPWPLSETAFLVSYSFGNPKYPAQGPRSEIDPSGYALYLIDVFGTRELIYRDDAISSFVPIPLRPRPRPPILPDQTDPPSQYATCLVADVARGVPDIPRERIRYLRISHRLQWPYSNRYGGERYESDAKAAPNWTPARVIGTVPIEADGSAYFRVPAGVPVYFQLLDENHIELRRMRSFISFQPGEQRSCVGCHETREEVGAVARFPRALACEPRTPVPPSWGTRPISFLRDVQPIFDRHCVGCHAGMKPAGGLDFSAGLTTHHNRAFDTINAHGLVSRSNVHDDARITMPLAFGSHHSKLVTALRDGPCANRAKLSDEEWLRLVTWIDANAPYHDGFINKRAEQPAYDLAADARLLEQITAIHARRCVDCHQPADVTRVDWIDLNHPEQSRFLAAPLSDAPDPRPKCPWAVYTSRDDPDYQAVLELVQAAVQRAWSAPRRDLRGLAAFGLSTARPDGILFGNRQPGGATVDGRQGPTTKSQ